MKNSMTVRSNEVNFVLKGIFFDEVVDALTEIISKRSMNFQKCFGGGNR